MKLPAVRFKITLKEYALLKPGLDTLANRLATARLGSFPFRHPWHRIDYAKSNVHQNQVFDEGMAERILSVRRKLWDLTVTRKVRLDALEIAAAILALRLHRPVRAGMSSIEGAQPLARKLEMLRKRALRAAISKCSRTEYRAQADVWRRFVAWCRYNLLYSRSQSRTSATSSPTAYLKKHWAEQRSQLAEMLAAALEKHCYAPLTISQMDRMVRLPKEEFRRGRHSLLLRELLANPDDNNLDLLFRLVSKKLELTPLPGAQLPICVVASELTERFLASRRRRRSSATALTPPSLPAILGENAIAGAPNDLFMSSHALSDEELAEAVAVWLERSVNRGHWEHVGTFAFRETLENPPTRVSVPPAQTLGQLVQRTRPRELDSTTLSYSALVAYLGEWVLTWLYGYRDRYTVIASILQAGFIKAARRNSIAKAA